jgi:hypothetical protein
MTVLACVNVVILLTLFIWLFLWLILYMYPAGLSYEMDWGVNQMSFLVPYAIYRRMFYVVFSVSLGMALLCVDCKLAIPAALLTAASIYAFLFNGWTAYCYEMYLQHRYPRSGGTGSSNYTAMKYSLTLALALSSAFLFVTGRTSLHHRIAARKVTVCPLH